MRALVAVVAALLGAACADDGGSGGPIASSAPSATVDCAGCRVVAPGNAFQDGDTAIGVTRCDAASCEVAVAAPDGTETELDLAVGDALDVGTGWVVVATGADGLTIRPA